MKIIKHGEVIHFACPVCGCEYMAREEETYKKPEEQEYYTVCPDCGESDVPGYKEQLSPDVEEQPAEGQTAEEQPAEEQPEEKKGADEEPEGEEGEIDYTKITPRTI